MTGTAAFIKWLLTCLIILQMSAAPAQTAKKQADPQRTQITLYGQASFYADKFHGRKTASGDVFSHSKFTAACNALPLGTLIQVTNLRNGKIVVVQTNDRLSPKSKRLIDLTKSAAKELGFIAAGLTRVKVIVLDQSLYKR